MAGAVVVAGAALRADPVGWMLDTALNLVMHNLRQPLDGGLVAGQLAALHKLIAAVAAECTTALQPPV